MIIAGHIIISTYGFWLPNDPRGSWSDFVRKWELFKFGGATKVQTRNSVARRPHSAALRASAKRGLSYPPVTFDGVQARAVGRGFAKAVERTRCVIHASAILPEHVHLVVRRHDYTMQQLTNLLKGNATRRLREEGLHPLAAFPFPDGMLPSPWAHGCWIVYINDPRHLQSAIRYVENNPIREGKPKQTWSFVVPYPASENAH